MSITYQNKVVQCETFAELWKTITHIFNTSSRTRIQSLKTQLRAYKKTSTASAYLSNIQKFVDSLIVIDCPIQEDDHIQAILDGLTKEYQSYITSVISRMTNFNVQEAECKNSIFDKQNFLAILKFISQNSDTAQ
ncbi:hypothetical protein AHAS_Ahas18G0100400 [Arachis hypogaea]